MVYLHQLGPTRVDGQILPLLLDGLALGEGRDRDVLGLVAVLAVRLVVEVA